jgi:hypothetical protein
LYSKREGGKGDRQIKGMEKEKGRRKCELDKESIKRGCKVLKD